MIANGLLEGVHNSPFTDDADTQILTSSSLKLLLNFKNEKLINAVSRIQEAVLVGKS